VGTFYSKPNPDAKAYVQIGDQVTPETIVCQIEAMKMFSEIPAGVSGTIKAILVKNEEAVDVNKPLFKVV
jgi:acetyl-CoA carboxylase biotin carboxyl carrier protein